MRNFAGPWSRCYTTPGMQPGPVFSIQLVWGTKLQLSGHPFLLFISTVLHLQSPMYVFNLVWSFIKIFHRLSLHWRNLSSKQEGSTYMSPQYIQTTLCSLTKTDFWWFRPPHIFINFCARSLEEHSQTAHQKMKLILQKLFTGFLHAVMHFLPVPVVLVWIWWAGAVRKSSRLSIRITM